MTQDAMIAIIKRNAFYKRLHYCALAVLLVALIVIGVMIGVIYYISGNSTKPLYFATDNVGRLINIIPVYRANMSDDEVVDWATEAIEAAYSYDFVNFHSQLQSAQKFFTTYGWTNYMSALDASNNLVALTKRKMVVKARVVNNPVILTKGILAGAFAWRIQLPLLVTYFLPPYDDAHTFNNPLIVTMIVQRQPMLESYRGLGVVQLIGAIATAPVSAPPPVSTTPT